ncbi:cytochrome c [Magnetospira sp. QH-2]|uniref:c-type cytochrome n=1 Tax=Magnetospira sp. (strain QH-2) TaxID=1288970 RepID=UPI0003E81A2C|nr:cytochrome c [Magnetospira sp. QH-2]CCQ73252.1 Putative cytochrome c, class I [Magnetospira sp. QH-2]
MRPTFPLGRAVAVAIALAFGAIAITPISASAEEDSRIARGGQLYDKWFAVTGAEKPKDTHKAWPASNTKKKGNATWRCKSCHGWDLRGKDGAYASGSYKTGIGGLRAHLGGDPAKVVAAIGDATHGLGDLIADADKADIALFVTKGQLKMESYIGADKSVKGDAMKGAAYYNTLCAGCHAVDGSMPKDLPKPLGAIAASNPWETLHKIQNGQPAEAMPALRALPMDVSLDILAYMVQKMPKK